MPPITSAGVAKLMRATDATMLEIFPATVAIAGVDYAAAGIGGNALSDYVDGGEAIRGTRVFRVPKTALAVKPASGTALIWKTAPAGAPSRFTVEDCPDRPHETSWHLRCVPRDR